MTPIEIFDNVHKNTVGRIREIPRLPDPIFEGRARWEDICNLSLSEIEAHDAELERLYTERQEVQRHNAAVYKEIESFLIEFFHRGLGISYNKLFKSDKILYRNYGRIIDEIKPKGHYVGRRMIPCEVTIGGQTLKLGYPKSYTEFFKTAMKKAEMHIEHMKRHNKLLVASLNYIEEHGLEVYNALDTKLIIQVAQEHAKEAYYEKVQGDEIEVTHGDGSGDCQWEIGDRRCECGNNRYYLEIEGDIINGFHHYGQWH